jgi:hypothetical protein
MQQWEYTKIDLNSASARRDDMEFLTDAGNERWELVAITVNNIAYLKRAVAGAKRTTRPSK